MNIKLIPATLCAVALVAAVRPAEGQTVPAELPFDSVALRDLSSFREPGPNWTVVGEVEADRLRERRMRTSPGTGVLANVAPAGRGAPLVTDWEHDDLELELDYLMPRGSNSGLYLQGRYELQLLDSWGVKNPTYSDAGGIYQRWDASRGAGREGYEGRAPRVNASRAPGLWQNLKIRFQAPRFDAQGRKVADARFVRVEHNGVVIHDNVEVTGPTRGSAFPQEAPTGPLLIQGDHGPIAFRNVRFKRYGIQPVRVSDVRFRAYEGEFAGLDALTAAAPARQGAAEGVTSAVAGVSDKFGVSFDGTLQVPTAGVYRFEMQLPWIGDDPHFQGKVVGGGRLVVGGREVLLHRGAGASASGSVQLAAGRHPFSLTYFKNRPWTDRVELGWYVEGTGVARQALHDTDAMPAASTPGAILVAASSEPVVLRSFMDHGERKRTHVVSVGDPTGVHYSLDAESGSLLYAWRGPFLEVTPMWHGRGVDQLALPLGSRLRLSGTPAVAPLADPASPWPDSAVAGYRFGGYRLDPAGRPVFQYRVGQAEVEDRVRPTADGNALRREIRVRAPDLGGLHARVAEGERIQRLRDGTYAVDGLRFYVALEPGGARTVVREIAGRQELLVPLRARGEAATVAYDIIW